MSLFPGGEERGGRKERNEGVRKEEVERSKEGRRGRRATSLPEWSLWGVRKCTPKSYKKEPKRLPNLCLEASGRPLASLGGPWGGPRLIFERFWKILAQIRAQKELWRLIFKHFRPRKGSKKVPKQLKIIENHAFLAFWRPLGDPQTSCLATFPK